MLANAQELGFLLYPLIPLSRIPAFPCMLCFRHMHFLSLGTVILFSSSLCLLYTANTYKTLGFIGGFSFFGAGHIFLIILLMSALSLMLARQGNGGGLPGGFQIPSTFNISAPFIILPISTIPGPPSSFITISTATTSTTTFSTTSFQTISTTTSTIVTQTLPITVIPTASLAAQQAAIKNNASLTRTNTIIVGVLCGFIILLILSLALCAFAWNRRRRRLQEIQDNSPSPASLAVEGSQPFQSQPAHAQATSTPLDLRGALSSHPPDPNRISFSRPFSLTEFHGEASQSQSNHEDHPVPIINIQPNTPSVVGHDDNTPISPILQAGPGRRPRYHEPLEEEASEGNPRLGVPIPERSAQRSSVSSAGSDYADGITGENTPERVGGVLHSTRASSGVFPESS